MFKRGGWTQQFELHRDAASSHYVSVTQGTVAVALASKDETTVSKHVACIVQLLSI